MMQNYSPISDTVDICEDKEEGTWFFQKYLMDGSGGTVESVSYSSREQAMKAWDEGRVKWES